MADHIRGRDIWDAVTWHLIDFLEPDEAAARMVSETTRIYFAHEWPRWTRRSRLSASPSTSLIPGRLIERIKSRPGCSENPEAVRYGVPSSPEADNGLPRRPLRPLRRRLPPFSGLTRGGAFPLEPFQAVGLAPL